MRATFAMVGAFLGVCPGSASANDLAEALNFAAGVMGDDIVEGYEEFMDWDETEALGILLDRQVTPHSGRERTPHFSSLGTRRSSFEALRPFIYEAADRTGLPVALIDAVIRTESGYRVQAVSRSGAQGLMQLMPRTARGLGVADAFDPRQNIMGGSRYLRRLFDRFGTLELAIAAYNAGPGTVARHKGVPPIRETRRYVQTVLRRYRDSPLAD